MQALPADARVGFPRDRKVDASTAARGLTEKTIFHCETFRAATSDTQRVTRAARQWISPGWLSGRGERVRRDRRLSRPRDDNPMTTP